MAHSESGNSDIGDYLEERWKNVLSADCVSYIVGELPELVASVKNVQLHTALSAVAGLMTVPLFHANAIRLEALAHLVVLFSSGNQSTSTADLSHWINDQLQSSTLCEMEDPLEDVFVSNVITGQGNCRIFTGISQTPDLWLQDIIDVLNKAPSDPRLNRLRTETNALLRLSDCVAERSNIPRFQVGGGRPSTDLDLTLIESIEVFRRVSFSPEDLDRYRIRRELLDPFIFGIEGRQNLLDQRSSYSELHLRPLVSCGNNLVLALPGAVCTALRMHILTVLASCTEKIRELFAATLRQRQEDHLLDEIIVRGLRYPVVENTLCPSHIATERMSQVLVTFDEDKFAHVVLLHDDCKEVVESGLLSYRNPPEKFQRKMMKYFADSAQRIKQTKSAVGMTVVIVGGVGRGLRLLSVDFPPKWALTVWTLPDAIAAAWLDEDWLLSLWKMLQQIEHLKSFGIEFDRNCEDVNVYSHWRDTEGSLIPRHYPTGSSKKRLLV